MILCFWEEFPSKKTTFKVHIFILVRKNVSVHFDDTLPLVLQGQVQNTNQSEKFKVAVIGNYDSSVHRMRPHHFQLAKKLIWYVFDSYCLMNIEIP